MFWKGFPMGSSGVTRRVLGGVLLTALVGCQEASTEGDAGDVQSPRKNPMQMIMLREGKSGVSADPWAILTAPATLTDPLGPVAKSVTEICKVKLDLGFVQTGKKQTCLQPDGVQASAAGAEGCLARSLEGDYQASFASIGRAQALAFAVLCKAKGNSYVSPAKKPGVVDLTDSKGVLATTGESPRYVLHESFVRSEKQTKGMYRMVTHGNFPDLGIKFAYEMIHMPHDRWNRESGGRITAIEQKGEVQSIVGAIYSIEDGVVSLRFTTAEVRNFSSDRLPDVLNGTTGLIDSPQAFEKSGAQLIQSPERWDNEADMNKGVIRRAMSRVLGIKSADQSRSLIGSISAGAKSRSVCAMYGHGAGWSNQAVISTSGMRCAANGPIQKFVQFQCGLPGYSGAFDPSAEWISGVSKIDFARTVDCGIGSPAFNLELINSEGHSAEIQSFDPPPPPPPLPGVSAPSMQ